MEALHLLVLPILMVNLGSEYGYLLKLDSNGRYEWFRKYSKHIDKPYNNGSEFTHIVGSTQLRSGGYILSGEYRSHPSDSFPGGVQQAILFKVDEHGCEVPGCQEKDAIEAVAPLNSDFTVFPNPSDGWFTIVGRNGVVPANIMLFDYLEKRVHVSSEGENMPTIHLNNTGLYYLKIERFNGQVEVHKVIVQ
ncbi:MAG: hypothetical protein ACI8ZN_000298 [Bacteroidia bacterium]|jgi:hypothetical protein